VNSVTDSELGQSEITGAMAKPILLVESVFQSAVLMSRVFRELNLLDHLAISMDCEGALVRLRQGGRVKPRLILVNREMSRMSATSFLKVLKEDRQLRVIPVIILANSYEPDEVADYYSLGTAGCMITTGDFSDALEKMRALCAYWALSRSPVIH
jgi:CheY-like chemotaxis protein